MLRDDVARPPVLGTALYSWQTALVAAKHMPSLFLATWIATWPVEILALRWKAQSEDDFSFAVQVVELLVIVLRAFLLTPLAIAVHRFALLGEVTRAASLRSQPARFLKFLVFALVFEMALALPLTILEVVKYTLILEGGVEAAFYLATIILTLFLLVVGLHVLLVFPAIAVDAANANWRAAISDSRGKASIMVATAIVICIPLLLTYVPYGVHFVPVSGLSLAHAAAFGLIDAAVSVLLIALYAAMASRLYLVFGRRLGRPEGLSIP